MITIRLNPVIFQPGGKFFGSDPGRTVLQIGTGKEEIYMAKPAQAFGMEHPSYRGGQTVLLIDRTGTQISEDTLEYYMQYQNYIPSVGAQLLDFRTQSLVIVEDDGVALTVVQLRDFVAP